METLKTKPVETKRRMRGRPAGANAQMQRQRILSHACDAFAAFGPETTRLQDIAERAGVDRRLVYHYFKSKDKLYLEVLQDLFAKLVDLSEDVCHNVDNLEEMIEKLMRRYYRFCCNNPAFVRVLMWENLRDVKGLREYADQCKLINVNFEILKPLILSAASKGKCRADLDPTMLLITCLSNCLYFLTNGPSLELIFGTKFKDEVVRSEWIDHAVAQVKDGIRPV
ncbi:TetR/AcrR family transcriptional regulator [Poriferisphaera sp. WC338]|uniref:TetR/AcrR family transcriptional regulator n=1 Tax=Poriferisphaera sp. WC338 TaxID=3425129 RepID=UPI003D81391A